MSDPSRAPAQNSNTDEQQAQKPNGGINIEELANRVYQLMLEEARLDRARGLSPKQGHKR